MNKGNEISASPVTSKRNTYFHLIISLISDSVGDQHWLRLALKKEECRLKTTLGNTRRSSGFRLKHSSTSPSSNNRKALFDTLEALHEIVDKISHRVYSLLTMIDMSEVPSDHLIDVLIVEAKCEQVSSYNHCRDLWKPDRYQAISGLMLIVMMIMISRAYKSPCFGNFPSHMNLDYRRECCICGLEGRDS